MRQRVIRTLNLIIYSNGKHLSHFWNIAANHQHNTKLSDCMSKTKVPATKKPRRQTGNTIEKKRSNGPAPKLAAAANNCGLT